MQNLIIVYLEVFITAIGLQGSFHRDGSMSAANDIRLPVIIIIRNIITQTEAGIMAKMCCSAIGETAIPVIDIIVIVLVKIIAYIDIIPTIVVHI